MLALNIAPTAAGKTPEEITVDAAMAAGIITDRTHWLGVISGITKPVPANIKGLMDNAVRLIKK